MRQIVLDTETTGLEPKDGHRIIEIGCVELVGRKLTGNTFHQYLQPGRAIDPGAIEVHGITNEFLADKPVFEDVVEDFIAFIRGAELVIHNAPFDVGFINSELRLCGDKVSRKRQGEGGSPRGCPGAEAGLGHGTQVADLCGVLDTLKMARRMHPGQKNNLDALCKRYAIDNSGRELHGALLDAEILADVYLAMTGGQVTLSLGEGEETGSGAHTAQPVRRLGNDRPALRVIHPDADELAAHEACIETLAEAAGGSAVWQRNVDG